MAARLCLGPILLNIFINDLDENMIIQCVDDTKLGHVLNILEDKKKFQRTLDQKSPILSSWTGNGLQQAKNQAAQTSEVSFTGCRQYMKPCLLLSMEKTLSVESVPGAQKIGDYCSRQTRTVSWNKHNSKMDIINVINKAKQYK